MKQKTLFDLYDGEVRSYSTISYASAETNIWPGISAISDDYQGYLKWKANQRKEKELEGKPLEVPKRLITVE